LKTEALNNSHLVKSSALFISSYFVVPERIGGGIGEHYAGLYGNFLRKYSSTYKIFWYSIRDRTLRTFDSHGKVVDSTTKSLPTAIFKAMNEARKESESRPLLTVIIAYHYVATLRPIGFLASLFLLQLLKLAELANTIIDVIDPPVEVHLTYSDSPSWRRTLFGLILDILTFKVGTALWFCSDAYQKYLTRKYKIPMHKTWVIYDGSFPNLIKPRPPRKEGPLTLFYSGSLVKVKGIAELIKASEELRKNGIEVNLLLTGGNLTTDKQWVKSGKEKNWFIWKDMLSEQADICVVPYPRKIHWDLAQHIKIVDYMAAGKPIVSMYYYETASFLRKCKCGLSANGWEEFKDHITRLYYDREFARTLGENGRKAVERIFNMENASQKLHLMIQEMLRATT